MDDPNITMEEYIRLEEEKARRHGQTFNWQTATFGKVENYEDEDDCSIDFETEFPSIVFDNTLTSIPSEPTVCPSNENEVDFRISLDESDDEDYTSSKDMAPLPAVDKRHHWLRYQIEEYSEGIRHSYKQRLETIWSRPVNRVYVLDFKGLTLEMRQDLVVKLRMVYSEEGQMSDTEMGLDVAGTLCFQLGGVRRRMTCRQFILALGLHTEQEMEEAGFGAYWDGSDRLIHDKGDLRDYWIEISSDKDLLGPAPSYVLIRDPVRKLCHRMIAYRIFARGQAPEKACRGEDERGQAVKGHFIGRLDMHFGLVSDEGLRGLQVVTQELPLIDLHELKRLHICTRYDDMDLGSPGTRERIERIEEEVYDLRRDVVGLQGVVESFTTEHSRVSTWLITCITQLMDASDQTYQPFDNTLIGSSRLSFQRCVRPRTGDASSFAALHTDAQPDP
ncbi:hypothetical protein Tco_1092268 [Tanacetum coccineum]|uniref:Uncharacterized protein n=1 Tax=Tanacetum coccineum TaxID=301880 RepID=A0ABQ5IAQ9_9ASTR